VFDPTGRRLAFAAKREGTWHVVDGGHEGPPYEEVDPPVFSADGAALGYTARRGFASLAVIGGHEGSGWAWAGDLVLGPGGRFAYLARLGDRSFVVDDRGQQAFDVVVSGTLAFARGGRRWGCVAGDEGAHKLFVAVEGGKRRPLDGEELVAAVTRLPADERLGQRPDEEVLRRWVAAELEIAAPNP
jgi:hypothetical protein